METSNETKTEVFILTEKDIIIERDIVKPEINVDPVTMSRPTDSNNCED